MLITIAVSDTIVRLAQEKKQNVEDFVEQLIDKSLSATTAATAGSPIVSDAMERIRALHSGLEHPR